MASRTSRPIASSAQEMLTRPEQISRRTALPTASRNPELDFEDRGLLHLGELIPELRSRLHIDVAALSDADVLESLKSITARTDTRARWLGAFNSTLGRWLVLRGSDLNTELNLVLSLLPPPRS